MPSILSRIVGWNRNRRQWERDHLASWAGQDVPGAAGLTPFQERCEAEAVALVLRRGMELDDRKVSGRAERFVESRVANVKLWIYRDQAQFSGPGLWVNLEHWDARTPEELIRDFVNRLDRALR